MNNHVSNFEIRQRAREALSGKWGKGACIVLANFLISLVLGIFGIIGDIISLIIQIPLTLGLTYSFIRLKRGEDVKAFEFLDLGFSNFGRAWKLAFSELAKLIGPIILLIISIVLMLIPVILNAASTVVELESYAAIGGITVFGAFILYLVSITWLCVRSLLYALTIYIAYDNPNMSSSDVVNESARMMNGNRGKIFLLSLSFIGWMILATLTLGIGLLWLTPYMVVAEVCFYEHLLGKNENNNSEENADAIKEM